MEIESGEGQLQIHLKTKQTQYAVPDAPYSIGANISTTELNDLVNTILKETDTDHKDVEFDFLVFDEYLKSNLGDHLKERGISFEDIINIEYVERFPAPEPQDCLLHDDWVSAVKTQDKWVLTGCYDNTINLWSIKGDHILTIPGHTNPIKAVAWVSLNDETGIFVSCSQDQNAMLWEWNIAQNSVDCVYTCKGHERGIDCVDVNADKTKFATGSWDTMLKIWSADISDVDDRKRSKSETGATRTPLATLQGHRENISAVQWMDSDTIITASWDHTIKFWDLSLEGIKSEITGNKSFFDISYSKLNGLIITSSADKNLRLYDSRTNQGSVVKNTYFGHTQWIPTVNWSMDYEHLFVSGSYDNQVKLWDLRSPKAPLYDLIGHGDKVMATDWSNKKYVVSGGADNSVRIFKIKKAFEKIKN
ncbi:ribosome biogenesis protein WDR12 homolog [Condylostylus longicornis]|uniref:ribosome biogenesis protein WDR12 homolog n=1 Tax=Condylostylus longicornis TaxID=2530218 RepID=UPI00244E1E39|nr:ribosome biogenesis protein WDR12 homolog [Condylostylus longicornis]